MSVIRATVFLRASDYTLLQMNTFEKGIDSSAETDLELIIRQIQNNNPRADERNKLQTGMGSWFYKLDENRICYLVLTSNSYPERHAFAMIKVWWRNGDPFYLFNQEMERELKKIEDYSQIAPKEVSKHVKVFIKDLSEKYNNLVSIDKVAQAQAQVDSLQANMEENVKKMLENNAMMDGLDEKANSMANNARDFSTKANELAKLMYWRNLKLKVIILLIVLAVLLYITIPLIITATQKKGSDSSAAAAQTTNTTASAGGQSTPSPSPPPPQNNQPAPPPQKQNDTDQAPNTNGTSSNGGNTNVPPD